MAKEQHSIDEGLQKALMGEDDLGRVVRSHLIIESRVNALLDLRVEYPKYFDDVTPAAQNEIYSFSPTPSTRR